MSIFTNPFFSIAGQKERISNVGKTLNAAFNPFSKDKVVANVSNTTLKSALEGVANHPYIAAAAVAAPITAVKYPAAAASAVKAILPTSKKGVIASVVAAPIIAGVVAKAPAKTLGAVANAPSALFNVGSNTGSLISDPSVGNLKNLVTENPVIVGGAAAVAAALLVKGLAPTIAATRQTDAIRDQTEAIKNYDTSVVSPTGQPVQIINQIPQIPQVPAVVAPLEAAPAGSTPKKTTKKKKKTKKKAKKKTRRSKKKTTKKKKKTTKKKKKSIKRRKK
jgi:hypothetical protein